MNTPDNARAKKRNTPRTGKPRIRLYTNGCCTVMRLYSDRTAHWFGLYGEAAWGRV